jgi:hypothetical protein
VSAPADRPAAAQPRFVCPDCGAASSHPDDIANGYCGRCHQPTGDPLWRALLAAAAEITPHR